VATNTSWVVGVYPAKGFMAARRLCMRAIIRGRTRLVRPSASSVHTDGRAMPSSITPTMSRIGQGGGRR